MHILLFGSYSYRQIFLWHIIRSLAINIAIYCNIKATLIHIFLLLLIFKSIFSCLFSGTWCWEKKPCFQMNNPFWLTHPINIYWLLISDWFISMNQSLIRRQERSIGLMHQNGLFIWRHGLIHSSKNVTHVNTFFVIWHCRVLNKIWQLMY